MPRVPVIAEAARKHQVSNEDILHAYRNPIRAWDMGEGFTMILGVNQSAILLEIGYIRSGASIVIVHAMRARKKFLR